MKDLWRGSLRSGSEETQERARLRALEAWGWRGALEDLARSVEVIFRYVCYLKNQFWFSQALANKISQNFSVSSKAPSTLT